MVLAYRYQRLVFLDRRERFECDVWQTIGAVAIAIGSAGSAAFRVGRRTPWCAQRIRETVRVRVRVIVAMIVGVMMMSAMVMMSPLHRLRLPQVLSAQQIPFRISGRMPCLELPHTFSPPHKRPPAQALPRQS